VPHAYTTYPRIGQGQNVFDFFVTLGYIISIKNLYYGGDMDFKETRNTVIDIDKNTKTFVRIWEPSGKPKAIFLAIHGGMAHCGDWVTPALYFNKKGIATVAFELRGHGMFPKYNKKSKLLLHVDSFDDYLKDANAVLKWIVKQYPGVPVFILGHSLGGLISLNWGLKLGKGKKDIKGFIVSAPWLKNLVVIPPVLAALAKVFAVVWPTFSSKTELSLDVLTHDPAITKRHYRDEKALLRGTMGTARFLDQATKAQLWTCAHMKEWKSFPLFVVLAGKDKLADSSYAKEVLGKIQKKLLTLVTYNENYHENFNEINREKIYDQIAKWMAPLMK